MTTGQEKVDIFQKKLLPQQEITANFFDYLQTISKANLFWILRSQGVFVPDISVSDILSSSANDTINFLTPLTGTDGTLGNVLNLDPAEAATVPFENTTGILYHTGLRFNFIRKGTEINTSTGKIKYTFFEERIGELAAPDTVTDDGDETLTIKIDSVCEAGVSFAGRKCRVWLKNAVSEAQAFEELTVIFVAGENRIETLTALGQQLGSISTTPGDYEVFLIGPTIKRNTDLRLDANVMYTGNVIGLNGGQPAVFDHSDVNNLSVGFSALSALFFAEHSNVDGSHDDVTVKTITTKQSVTGVQFDTQVNVADEDSPDAPTAHTLFASGGGTGIQGVKWRLRDSSGNVLAFVDAHGNAYFQNLAAVTSIFAADITVTGNQIIKGNTQLGDNIANDTVTFNSILQSLTNFEVVMDSNNDGTGHEFNIYNHSVLLANLLFRVTEVGDATATRDMLTKNKTAYSSAVGTAIVTNASLNETHDETLSRKLLKATVNSPNDNEVNIAAGRIVAADGSAFTLTLGNVLANFPGAILNFFTGDNSVGANFVNRTFTNPDFWFKFSVNLLKDNTLLIIPGSAEAATKTTAINAPLVKGAAAVVMVAVQNLSATSVTAIRPIAEANLDRIPLTRPENQVLVSVDWLQIPAVAPIVQFEDSVQVAMFEKGKANKLIAYVKIPNDHNVDEQIDMDVSIYSPSIVDDIFIKSTTFLIRKDTDAFDSAANSHVSTNVTLANSGTTKLHRQLLLDLTDPDGLINSIAPNPGDVLRIELDRGADADAADLRFVLPTTGVLFA